MSSTTGKASNQEQTRDTFGSKFGVIAAAAGAAVGLGNIWKFPYIVGANGGGAFLIIYLACILILGMALMLCEFLIGRRTGLNAVGAFKKLAPKTPWFLTGWMGIISSILILSFYSAVSGWCLKFMFFTFSGGFNDLSPEAIGDTFGSFITSYDAVFYQIIILLLTAGTVLLGVKKGIERATKILMPVLVVLLIAMAVNSLLLPGSIEGVKFLFMPNWELVTADSILIALGHSFFTLSLGIGGMLTYGAYIKKEDNLATSVVSITAADTLIALLAGLVIFPAVFSFGLETGEGAGLVFVTLPNIFNALPFGQYIGGLFFFLLTIAALTSTISLLEIPVAYFEQTFKLTRPKATLVGTAILVVTSLLCSLSYTDLLGHITVFGFNFFDLADRLTNDYLMPFGGLLIAIFTGWYLNKADVLDEISVNGKIPWYAPAFLFTVKYVAPILIIIVFLNTIGIVG